MSFDLIELALDRITDFADFERLATEVMYLDGWHGVRPLGGTADLGQDAVSERFFRQADVERTVFQYTLQEYLPGKIADTITKLRDNKIEFYELILVTPHAISSDAQIKMKRDARAKHGVTLDIYERKTIVTRLADLQNGVFNRHFPNIKAQLEDITRAASRAALPKASLERTLIQVSLALTFRPGAHRARKSVFDHFVLAVVLAETKQTLPLDAIGGRCAEALHTKVKFPQDQIEAAIGRLSKDEFVRESGGIVRSTEKAIAEVATGTMRLNEATDSFASDIVSEVEEGRGKRVGDDVARRIKRNTAAALLEIARNRGAAIGASDVHDSAAPDIVKWQLNDDVAGLVEAALAQALRSPTEEQAKTIAQWTQAYVGFALMGLDPTLNAFQSSRFSKKIFIIDTDVVLEAAITDGPRSAGLRALLASLIKLGCRLIIPQSVIGECLQHVALSEPTYNYFGSGLHQLTPALVEERVWNAVVKGYYYAHASKRISASVTYQQYLANFYEPKRGRLFLADVIKEVLPDTVEVASLDSLLDKPLDRDEIDRFADELQKDLASSKKARYRTDEEEKALARTDAILYLTALRLNPPDETTKADILGGTCYLLTGASRYGRIAKSVGVSTKLTVRPGALAAILELIGSCEMAPSEFVQLFDNPLLDRAVTAAWPDIDALVRTGVDLRGRSLPRLRFDLADALHAQLTALSVAEEAEDEGRTPPVSSDEEFLRLIETATARGYSTIPEVEKIRARIRGGEKRADELQQMLDDLMAQNEQLEQQIGFFGKRRRRYLRRMKQGQRQGG